MYYLIIWCMLLAFLFGVGLILSPALTILVARFARKKLAFTDITIWMDNAQEVICIICFVLSIILASIIVTI